MPIRGYYLGCPGWADKAWVGRLFPAGTRPSEFLARYAEVFNTVEGNTTFYALPSPDTVLRWRDDVPTEFRFCFKFPRTISHDKQLVETAADVATFIDRITPLGDKLGTLFLQLPPSFGPDRLAHLRRFVDALPHGFRYGVELRHPLWFAGGHEEIEVIEMLREREIDVVMMDARGLHAGATPGLAEVRDRKPDLPVVVRTTGPTPIVRCVPHEDFETGIRFVQSWIPHLARWIRDGKRPYFFMHAPDDAFAPENAYRLHAMLTATVDVGDLPVWPGQPRQLGLL